MFYKQRRDYSDVQASLLQHFAADGFIGVFASSHPTTGHPPWVLRMKYMFNQQHFVMLVEYHPDRANRAPWLEQPIAHYTHNADPWQAFQKRRNCRFIQPFIQHTELTFLVC